ncbi:unnamed protein product [Ectocarpus sp. CCAP 1310/34]|nr:unnamed protein product [Ectocarpus sp. CCAP 1310/34]
MNSPCVAFSRLGKVSSSTSLDPAHFFTTQSGHEAETTGAISVLDASEGLASRWTTAYWRLATDTNNSDAAQTSVAGATANNGNREKELRADMHVIGDRLTVR